MTEKIIELMPGDRLIVRPMDPSLFTAKERETPVEVLVEDIGHDGAGTVRVYRSQHVVLDNCSESVALSTRLNLNHSTVNRLTNTVLPARSEWLGVVVLEPV